MESRPSLVTPVANQRCSYLVDFWRGGLGTADGVDGYLSRQSFHSAHLVSCAAPGGRDPCHYRLRGGFSETTPYDPRSPYSASKAASDHQLLQ